MFFRLVSLLVVSSCVVAACGGDKPDAPPTNTRADTPAARATDGTAARSASPTPAPAAVDQAPRIIFLGDSLTAGLGLSADRSFPALIEARLKAAGYGYSVVNAGVSGDTSAGGLRRLEWALGEGDPRILVVALGGNDGLRGLPPSALEKNLAAMIEAAERRDLAVILAGMEAPPNYGPDYTAAFRKTYRDLAARYQVPLVPFLLQGVAGDAALNQPDGIHPNERGARVVADLVWQALEPVVKKDQAAHR